MIKIIKISLRPNQTAKVIFSNHQQLVFSTDQIVKLNLTTGQSVSNYPALVNTSLLFQLKSFALRQIAISPKTEFILQRKLTQKLNRLKSSPSDPKLLIDQTLKYIQSKNLLNPVDFAQLYIKRHQKKPAPLLKILLKKQGVSQSIIDQLNYSSDVSKIKKYLSSHSHLPKNKLLARLARRGFSYHDIKTAIDDS